MLFKKERLFKFISFLSIALMLSLTIMPGSTTFANENVNLDTEENVYLNDVELSEEDLDFINKVVSLSEFYEVNTDTNKLEVSLDKNSIISDYHFTEEEYDRLVDVVLNHQVNNNVEGTVTPYVHVSNGALYISHNDLTAGIFASVAAAALVSPVALQAALIAVSSVVGGPVGAVLGTIMTVISGPSLIELGGRIVTAVATGRGIYIKPVFDYPPLDIGYW